MKNLIKPPRLKKGNAIGIVATSFPFPIDKESDYFKQYRKGVEKIESMGFKVREGKNLRKVKWWFAGTPKERAEDINSMFASPEIKAIIVHDGGQSAIAVLEHINYGLVKTNPKPFIGFSDVTNIHSALFTQVGMVGFHAALLTYGLGKAWEKYPPEKIEEGKKMLFKVLTSTDPIGVINPLSQWECWRSGESKGKLFGGNLSMLTSLVGTKYFPKTNDLKGHILFWEMDNTSSYKIEKGLYQLKYSGILDAISGMLIGKLPDIKRTAWEGFNEPTPKEIIIETLKDYNFPIIGNMDFGHKTIDLPIPIGLEAKFSADNLFFEVLESAVK
jgi:muramoyltetrapeptide carboxypeptidase